MPGADVAIKSIGGKQNLPDHQENVEMI